MVSNEKVVPKEIEGSGSESGSESAIEKAERLNKEIEEKEKRIDEKIAKIEELQTNSMLSGRAPVEEVKEEPKTASQYRKEVEEDIKNGKYNEP